MKLVEMKCKNCGSILKLNPDEKDVTCEYCKAQFKLDDEVQHIKYDDMEQAGYEMEKGKIRARKEAKQEEENARIQQQIYINNEEKKKKNLKWWILGWIFMFPIPLTILIWRSKWDKKKKIIVTAIVWVVILIIGATSSSQEQEDKKNKLIKCYSQETYDKLNELIGIENINGSFSETTSCDNLSLKNNQYKKIEIEMESNKLISIKLDNKFIYSIDETVEIYDPITLRVKESDSEANKIFGEQKSNAYYDNEKNIRKFVTGYNKISENKINKVEWSKNHTIAYLYFDSERCKINDHSEKGFIITCDFNQGKEKLADYEKILTYIMKTYDSNISEDTIKDSMNKGNANNMNLINVTDKITIEYNYAKEQVGIRAANNYIIELTLGK